MRRGEEGGQVVGRLRERRGRGWGYLLSHLGVGELLRFQNILIDVNKVE